MSQRQTQSGSGLLDPREESIASAEVAPPVVERTWRTTLAGGLLRAARPKQWMKNGLVLAAPAAAGVLDQGDALGNVLLAFVAFCLASSGTYYLNDVADIQADRADPVKRFRPIALGVVPRRLAVAVGVALVLSSLALALAVNLGFLGVLALYLAMTTAYSLWLKHLPIVDIGVVAAGFILRAVAGGVAVDVPISRWFLIVASFGSLFMVAGKRHGEQVRMGGEGGPARATLDAYTPAYLHSVWTMASAVTVTAYCLWAFEQSQRTSFPWFELTIIPFVLAILRYALVLEAGKAAAPEDVLIRDRSMQVLSVVWGLLFGLAIYIG
jgi:decaprenyl-phosphate phosphoribosyltransferase